MLDQSCARWYVKNQTKKWRNWTFSFNLIKNAVKEEVWIYIKINLDENLME